jgi:K+-sensing histidine kinase KdpD
LSGAIIFTFVQWGIGPGVVALLIGIFNTDYFFVEPLYEFNFGSATRLLGLAYALMAFSAYWLSERRRTDAS